MMQCFILFSAVLVFAFQSSYADRIAAAKVGTCRRKVAYGIIRMRRFECTIMGGAWNGSPGSRDWIDCHLDWCQVITSETVGTGQVWAVCEYDIQTADVKRTYGIIRMIRSDCDKLNGKYNGNPTNSEWTDCHLYWCQFDGQQYVIDGIVPASVDQCSGPKVAYGIIRMISRECTQLGGKWNGDPGANDWIDCHLDMCVTIACEPRDEWADIQVCDNKYSSATFTCSITYKVGTSKTTSSENGGSTSITVEQSFELEGIFKTSLKTTTGFSWSTSSSETYTTSSERTLSLSIPPHTSVKMQQVTGYCGNYRVDTVHYRNVDVLTKAYLEQGDLD